MKIALVFPGYASQYVGMGKELYDEYRIIQEYFEEASSCTNINFVKLCFASSDVELSKLSNAYMSLFLIGSSVFALLKEQGVIPEVVAGYNNGEVTALFAGGCFSLPDGLYLLNKFCSFYQETLDQTDVTLMRIEGKTTQELENLCHKISTNNTDISIAFYDDESNHVVVGKRDVVSQLQSALEAEDAIKIDYLSAEIGFHSPFMEKAIDQFKIYLEKVDFKDLTIPMISGIDGRIITQGSDIKDRFIRHFVSPFKFASILSALYTYDLILIATPSQTLSSMIKNYYPEKNIITIEKKADIEVIREIVQNNITDALE